MDFPRFPSSCLRGGVRLPSEGHAKSVRDVLVQIDSVKPDVVLPDVTLKDESGIATVCKLHEHDPSIRVLGWTAYEAPLYASELIRAGTRSATSRRAHRRARSSMPLHRLRGHNVHLQGDGSC